LSNYPKTAESTKFAKKLKLKYSPSAVSAYSAVSFEIVRRYVGTTTLAGVMTLEMGLNAGLADPDEN